MSTKPGDSQLDQRAMSAMALLVFLALLINLDRFVLGTSAPLRAHDLADNTITRLGACGELWRSSLSSAWDASRLRGWPIAGGDFHPQLLMCVVGGTVPAALVAPILHSVLLAVMAAGTFLFVRYFLRRSQETAVAGAVLYLVLYFFFHEHPMVASSTLLPALAGFLSLPGDTRASRWLLFGGAALVMLLSNPPSTLVLMPLGHIAVVFAAPRADRWRHASRAVAFWCAYGLYFAPTMVAHLSQFGDSNRSLFRPAVGLPSFTMILRDRLLYPAILSPALVLVVLINRRTWRGTALLLLGIVGLVALSAANQAFVVGDLGTRFPLAVTASTLYYRFFYFVPIALLVWATWLFEHLPGATTRSLIWRVLGVGVFTLAVAYPLSGTSRVLGPYWHYALVLGLAFVLGSWWTRRTWTVLVVGGAMVLFSRWEYTRVYEVPFQGNLFVEAPHFGLPRTLSRTVTVMSDCDAVDVFPAQARVAGEETLDGVSNAYDRGFAERWRYFVAHDRAFCTGRFAEWSTRAEVTIKDLTYSADRILPWLWVNNVRFVRSVAPLDYAELQLIDQRTFAVDRTHQATRYLYQFSAPVDRVFALPAALAARAASADLAVEEQALQELYANGSLLNVPAARAGGSRLQFSAALDPASSVVVNMNYHPGWTFSIDGQATTTPLLPGPFGMLSFTPVAGLHLYEVAFQSRATYLVPVCMVAALAFLWFVSGPVATRQIDRIQERIAPGTSVSPALTPRRAFMAWAVAVGGLALAGAAVALRSRASAEKSAAWFDRAWPYRIPLSTQGAYQTAPITDFPLRVQFTTRQTSFWTRVHPSGADLRFVDAEGGLLAFEIEEFDHAEQRLIAWVRIPELSPRPQRAAYLYYGNPNAADRAPDPVWDAHHAAVWHMNAHQIAREGVIADSTGLGHFASWHGPRPSPAGLERGVPFDGHLTWAEVADSTGLQFEATDWTVEFWLQPQPLNGRNLELLRHAASEGFDLFLHNGGYLKLEQRNGPRSSEVAFRDDPIAPSRWTAVALTRTRRHVRLAIDGVSRSASQIDPGFAAPLMSVPLRLGTGDYGFFEGRLAEIRISRGVARSPDWILAGFRSQSASFVEIGSVESLPGSK